MAYSGTTESGHMNIGKARHACAGKETPTSVGKCMTSWFNKHPPQCHPKAKTCHGRKKRK